MVLSEVKTTKYLGVFLSCDLSWSPHIASIVSQAHQRLSFLRRNLRGSPFRYRGTAYESLVRSQLEYCCTIWDPTPKGEIERIKRVQRHAVRWAKGAYGMTSVTRLLKELRWQDLADRRRHNRLILLYKILNYHISVPPDKVSLIRAARPAHRASQSSNPTILQRPRASHKSSPLWKSPISAPSRSWIVYPLLQRRPIHFWHLRVGWRRPRRALYPLARCPFRGHTKYRTRQDKTDQQSGKNCEYLPAVTSLHNSMWVGRVCVCRCVMRVDHCMHLGLGLAKAVGLRNWWC